MRSGILIVLMCGLAGCATQSSTVLEPVEQQPGWPAPAEGGRYPAQSPTPGDSGTGYSAPRTGSTSSTARRPATVAYSPSSTGVTAADALLREGNALHQRGEYGGAANNFERGIRMAPRSPALYLALAKTRLAMGDNTNAIQMANRALSLLPSGSWAADDARTEAWNVIANAREAQGDRTGAAAARQKAKGW